MLRANFNLDVNVGVSWPDQLGDSKDEIAEEEVVTADGSAAEEVLVDNGLQEEGGYKSEKFKLHLVNAKYCSPVDYFMFFLPLEHLHVIINNINVNAENTIIVKHDDRNAYWRHARNSHFRLTIDFSNYMSQERFNNIMLTLDAFNEHIATCLTPGTYLIIDKTMNQWLGLGIPNLRKTLRKPNSIAQEFKLLVDYHTKCSLRLDTVSDPCAKECDNEPGMHHLLATVKKLVKLWISSGRTLIADARLR
ncbi:hypothetical protein BD770DRAFT_444499 [Pilaira anomala]|nr:hypothetical protein BD770DRAFT_444499 [Pilaira anomala]